MSSVPVKVYRGNEIRRFSLESGDSGRFDFESLLKNIRQVFPDLDHGRARLMWKDSDDEMVGMSSDLELSEAVRGLPAENPVLRVHVIEPENVEVKKKEPEKQPEKQPEPEKKKPAGPPPHRDGICDGCFERITGVKWFCPTCNQFNWCADCQGTGIFQEHAKKHTTWTTSGGNNTRFVTTTRGG